MNNKSIKKKIKKQLIVTFKHKFKLNTSSTHSAQRKNDMVKKGKKSSRKTTQIKVRVIGFKSISAKKSSPKKKR